MTQPGILIWDYVKDLLHVHDCVIVPGFGGFVCNREPARIDQVSHIITPPSRKVVFNQNLKTNDGLLAEFWSQKQNVTYSQALSVIDTCIESIVNTLQDKKQLSIDLFGSFRLNAEANYVFLPDKRNNYLTSSYGLVPIQAQPVVSRVMRLPKIKSQPAGFKTKPAGSKSRRSIWTPVLATVIIGLLTINGYIFLNDPNFSHLRLGGDNNTMNISSWFDSLFHQSSGNPVAITPAAPETDSNAFIPPAPVMEQAELAVENKPEVPAKTDLYASYYAFATHYSAARASIYVPQQPEDLADDSIFDDNAADISTTPETPSNTEISAVTSEHGYYVIGGVFCKERNARRFLKKLKESGYDEAQLVITQTANCKRVSYKKFAHKGQAESYCLQLKNTVNPEAWILELTN